MKKKTLGVAFAALVVVATISLLLWVAFSLVQSTGLLPEQEEATWLENLFLFVPVACLVGLPFFSFCLWQIRPLEAAVNKLRQKFDEQQNEE